MRNNLLINSVMINWDKISRESYLRDIPAISGTDRIDFTHPVTFFVGENGSGKSTLLEAIAVSSGFNPEGGTKNYNFSTYDSHSELCNAIRLSRGIRRAGGGYFLRAESFYNVATMEEEYSRGPGGIPQHYHEKSHGESFLALVQNSFRPNGLYLLDEPEAALSPQRQLTEAADSAHGDRPLSQGGFTVYNRDTFANPAGTARRGDPEFRRRGDPSLFL